MNNLIKLILSTCLISFAFSVYNVGQTVSSSDQNIDFNVCYGDYDNDQLSLSDFTDGNTVIWINMSASW